MATTKAPLFGLDASGTIGAALVFSKWRGRTYVRKHAVPSNPRSGLQLGMRAAFKFLTQSFGALSTAEKAEWDDLAAPQNITQLNAQVRDGQTRARLNQGWRMGPSEAAGTTPDIPTAAVGSIANASTILTWSRPAGNKGDYCTAIYVGATGSVLQEIQFLRAVIAVTLETVTITGLTNGTAYTAYICEMNTDGEFGAVAASNSFTPAA